LKAGLNRYTFLKEVKGWSIERKVDIQHDQIQCRASIPQYGTWFSSRIRLNKKDQLVIPPEINDFNLTNDSILETVKVELKLCRSGFIYIPQ
tara:strand:- start:1340 stop:1615 length:276 start_codon:yes stop_codon:yes gene_type:complete